SPGASAAGAAGAPAGARRPRPAGPAAGGGAGWDWRMRGAARPEGRKAAPPLIFAFCSCLMTRTQHTGRPPEILLAILTDLSVDHRCYKWAQSLRAAGYRPVIYCDKPAHPPGPAWRSEEHTSELQSRE